MRVVECFSGNTESFQYMLLQLWEMGPCKLLLALWNTVRGSQPGACYLRLILSENGKVLGLPVWCLWVCLSCLTEHLRVGELFVKLQQTGTVSHCAGGSGSPNSRCQHLTLLWAHRLPSCLSSSTRHQGLQLPESWQKASCALDWQPSSVWLQAKFMAVLSICLPPCPLGHRPGQAWFGVPYPT